MIAWLSFTLALPLLLGERALGIQRIRGWVGPAADLDVVE
jgi:hypothetical protein